MSRLRLGFLLPLAFLLAGAPPHSAAAQEQPLQGLWTGGFMLRGAWVAVNLRVAAPGDSAGDTADLLFPSYGGAENAINVAVEALNQTPNSVHFEVPAARNQRVVFEGRADDSSITGKFVYGQTTGTFGLTRWARLPIDSLDVLAWVKTLRARADARPHGRPPGIQQQLLDRFAGGLPLRRCRVPDLAVATRRRALEAGSLPGGNADPRPVARAPEEPRRASRRDSERWKPIGC